jgi:hypothetical protein
LVLQVSLELPHALLDRGDGLGIRFLGGDDSAALQKIHKLLQRGPVAPINTPLTGAMPQVLCRMSRTDISDADSLSLKPFTEARRQDNSAVYSMPRIPLLKCPYAKRPDVRCKRTFRRSPHEQSFVDDVLHT